MRRFLIIAAPLFLSACGGSGDDTTLSRLADDVISYVTTGRTVAENQRALVAGQGCGTDASLFGNGDCKVGAGATMGFVDRNGTSAIAPLAGARNSVYAVNAPAEDWSKPGNGRVHPFGKSADVMIVDLPPAASQLVQPNKDNALAATSKADMAKAAPADNVDAPQTGPQTATHATPKDMASAPQDAPRTEVSALPDEEPASMRQDASAKDAAKVGDINGQQQAAIAPDDGQAMTADKPRDRQHDLDPSDVSQSSLPPAPIGAKAGTKSISKAKAALKTPLEGNAVGPDAHKQASGKDEFETSAAHGTMAGKYVVLGSFNSQKRARIALDQFSQYHPQLIPATVKGTPYLRIAVGPMNMARANDLRLVTAKNGVKDSWILNIDGSGE